MHVMDNIYQKSLIKIHSAGMLLYIATAWLVTMLAGCEEYGLSSCTQKEVTVYVLFLVTGLVPILLSLWLNRLTSMILFVYSILVSIALFPIGTVIGILSIFKLKEYSKNA